MKRIILLFSLLTISIQVDHCFIEEPVCKTCKDGYYIVNDKYCTEIENCYTVSGNKCLYCGKGYYASDDGTRCIKKEIEDLCSSFSSGECMSCEKGYALKGNTNKCVEFENCRRTNEEGSKCKECDTFYQPNEKGECVINFCFSFNDDGSCKECFENFYLDEDGNCQLNKIHYCEYGNETYCRDWQGFVKTGNIEEDKEKYIKKEYGGCDDENSDGTCKKCQVGFTLNEETKECISNCKEYMNPSTICDYCEYGYINVDNDKTCYQVIKKDEEDDEDGDENGNGNGMKFISLSVAFNLFFSLFLFY